VSICGGRPGADALQTAIDLGFTLEEAMILQKRGLLMISLDLSKFFDSIEWGLLENLARELGLPESYLQAFLSFLQKLRRRFKVGDTFSEDWKTTLCGTPQGDAMSIIWANLSSLILSMRMSKLGIGHKIYVDDRYLWGRTISVLKRTLSEVSKFDSLAKNRLNPDKTKLLASSPYLRKQSAKILFDGFPLKVVKHLKALGCTLSSVKRQSNAEGNRRADKAFLTAKRARCTLGPHKFKKRVISGKVCPQMAYGAALSSSSRTKLIRVRTAAIRLVWGRGRSKRAPELVLLVLTDPCRTDPQSAIAVEAILSIMRAFRKNPNCSFPLLT